MCVPKFSDIPIYHSENINVSPFTFRSAFLHLGPSSGATLSSNLNRNFNKQLSTSPGGISSNKHSKEAGENMSNVSFTAKKEFEPSNLLRIKSNKLGSSAPNLCSSMVSAVSFILAFRVERYRTVIFVRTLKDNLKNRVQLNSNLL